MIGLYIIVHVHVSLYPYLAPSLLIWPGENSFWAHATATREAHLTGPSPVSWVNTRGIIVLACT